MKAYYLEDGSAGHLRTIWSPELETSRQIGERLEFVRISAYLAALNTDGFLKGRTPTYA